MTDISFTEFSARLAVGDTLRILHSTYPGSELSANDYVDAREARVTRIGKRRVDLVNKSGKTHVVEATADVYTNLGATYKVATLRGYINVQHISLQIPKHVTDVEVYRWHHAHWGLKQVLATSCAHWNPMSGGWLFFGHDTCYARSEKELRYKFDMHHKKQQVKAAGPKAAIESLAKQWGLNEQGMRCRAFRGYQTPYTYVWNDTWPETEEALEAEYRRKGKSFAWVGPAFYAPRTTTPTQEN